MQAESPIIVAFWPQYARFVRVRWNADDISAPAMVLFAIVSLYKRETSAYCVSALGLLGAVPAAYVVG